MKKDVSVEAKELKSAPIDKGKNKLSLRTKVNVKKESIKAEETKESNNIKCNNKRTEKNNVAISSKNKLKKESGDLILCGGDMRENYGKNNACFSYEDNNDGLVSDGKMTLNQIKFKPTFGVGNHYLNSNGNSINPDFNSNNYPTLFSYMNKKYSDNLLFKQISGINYYYHLKFNSAVPSKPRPFSSKIKPSIKGFNLTNENHLLDDAISYILNNKKESEEHTVENSLNFDFNFSSKNHEENYAETKESKDFVWSNKNFPVKIKPKIVHFYDKINTMIKSLNFKKQNSEANLTVSKANSNFKSTDRYNYDITELEIKQKTVKNDRKPHIKYPRPKTSQRPKFPLNSDDIKISPKFPKKLGKNQLLKLDLGFMDPDIINDFSHIAVVNKINKVRINDRRLNYICVNNYILTTPENLDEKLRIEKIIRNKLKNKSVFFTPMNCYNKLAGKYYSLTGDLGEKHEKNSRKKEENFLALDEESKSTTYLNTKTNFIT